MIGARAKARSRAVWPLAGSYFAVGHEVGLPDRREPWRVPASVGQLEHIHLLHFTSFPVVAARPIVHSETGEVGHQWVNFCAQYLQLEAQRCPVVGGRPST